jgi:LysR family transcriptional regulator, transcriptional activator of nhaA
MDRLNYHHLLYFFTVAQEGSVAKASQCLGVAQPTVSAQIHALEQKLGRKLLERKGRGLRVTPDGKLVVDYASSIFTLGGELLGALDGHSPNFHSKSAPPLNIGVSSSLPQAISAMLLPSLLALKPSTALSVVEAAPDALAERLTSAASLQFALLDSPIKLAKLHSRRLLESPLALFAPEPLARKLGKDFPSRVTDTPVLMPLPGALRQQVEQWLKAHKLAVRKLGEMPNPELCARAAKAAVFAPWIVRNSLRSVHGLHPVSQLDGVLWRIYLVTPEKGSKHPGIDAMMAAARELR